MTTIVLKKGREESLLRFHPWIFSGAVASVSGAPYEGEVVEVVSSERKFLAYGHYQKGSIAVRVLTFSQDYRPQYRRPYAAGILGRPHKPGTCLETCAGVSVARDRLFPSGPRRGGTHCQGLWWTSIRM